MLLPRWLILWTIPNLEVGAPLRRTTGLSYQHAYTSTEAQVLLTIPLSLRVIIVGIQPIYLPRTHRSDSEGSHAGENLLYHNLLHYHVSVSGADYHRNRPDFCLPKALYLPRIMEDDCSRQEARCHDQNPQRMAFGSQGY